MRQFRLRLLVARRNTYSSGRRFLAVITQLVIANINELSTFYELNSFT